MPGPRRAHGTFVSASNHNGLTASVMVTSATRELLVDTVGVPGDATSLTAAGGQTPRWNEAHGTAGGDVRNAGSTKPGEAYVIMSWTLSSSKAWTSGAISLKPALLR